MTIGYALAYTNIALIKYWGKADEQFILPMNSSLSLTLDQFYTKTRVQFDPTLSQDTFILNHVLQTEQQKEKVSAFLTLVRQLSGCPYYAQVVSENHVPTAAGLASSSSGFAALAGACSQALRLQLSPKDLSRLARRGSGSACRSIFGGFAQWEKGDSDETSFAFPIPSDGWEQELAMLFVVINQEEKKISSRSGMKRTVDTSSFYPGWLQTVEQDIQTMTRAIATKNFQLLGETMEANGLRMHGTTLAAVPPFTYWTAQSMAVMEHVQKLRQQGILCYFTMDAGPNVKILVQRQQLQAVQAYLQQFFSVEQLICASVGPGIQTWHEKEEENV